MAQIYTYKYIYTYIYVYKKHILNYFNKGWRYGLVIKSASALSKDLGSVHWTLMTAHSLIKPQVNGTDASSGLYRYLTHTAQKYTYRLNTETHKNKVNKNLKAF